MTIIHLETLTFYVCWYNWHYPNILSVIVYARLYRFCVYLPEFKYEGP